MIVAGSVAAVTIRLLPRGEPEGELPIYGGHGVGVDAGAVGRPERRMWRAAADRGLATRHLRALLAAAALSPLVLHLVTPHAAPTLSNGILTPYKHLICNETITRLHASAPEPTH
jgi:hypothetical protein